MIKKTFFRGPVQKYSASGEFSDSRIAGSEGKADGFAADLCVVSGDTLLDTVALEEDQEGLLLDIKNKQVLYSKGAYDRVYPVSYTHLDVYKRQGILWELSPKMQLTLLILLIWHGQRKKA